MGILCLKGCWIEYNAQVPKKTETVEVVSHFQFFISSLPVWCIFSAYIKHGTLQHNLSQLFYVCNNCTPLLVNTKGITKYY